MSQAGQATKNRYDAGSFGNFSLPEAEEQAREHKDERERCKPLVDQAAEEYD
jgi:hypothetical protein